MCFEIEYESFGWSTLEFISFIVGLVRQVLWTRVTRVGNLGLYSAWIPGRIACLFVDEK